jgi:hypothetical protein
MIQRIQSLYLLVAIGLITVLFFLPYYSANTLGTDTPVLTTELSILKIISNSADTTVQTQQEIMIFPLILAIIIIAFSLVALFWFKNRKRQILLCRFLILLTTGLAVAMIFGLDKIPVILQGQAYKGSYSLFAAFPVVALLLYFLAARSIAKDEKLVKSADRFR